MCSTKISPVGRMQQRAWSGVWQWVYFAVHTQVNLYAGIYDADMGSFMWDATYIVMPMTSKLKTMARPAGASIYYSPSNVTGTLPVILIVSKPAMMILHTLDQNDTL